MKAAFASFDTLWARINAERSSLQSGTSFAKVTTVILSVPAAMRTVTVQERALPGKSVPTEDDR